MKDKLSKIGDKTDKTQGSASGEGFDRSVLSLQSEPGIVVGGEFRGGDTKVSVGKDDPQPDDSRSVSRSAVGIGHDVQGGSDDKASGAETSQKHLHPHPHVQTEGGSSRERRDADGKRVDRADPPPRLDIVNVETSSLSISQGGESESTWTALCYPPPLIDDAGDSAVPDPVRVDDAATSKDKPDWKSTASSAAKLLLRTVEKTSDAFPPLKSVAAGLCAVLDNCEVRFTVVRSVRDAYSLRSK